VREAATICPHPLQVDLWHLILKVVSSESRVTWATSVPILVFPGLSVLDYYASALWGRGHNKWCCKLYTGVTSAARSACYRASEWLASGYARRAQHCYGKSVCLSVTPRYNIEMNAHIVTFFSQSGRGMNVFFYRRYKIPGETPSTGALNIRSWEKFAISREIAVYLGNNTRYAHALLWNTNRKS